jgi:hypothetical protein
MTRRNGFCTGNDVSSSPDSAVDASTHLHGRDVDRRAESSHTLAERNGEQLGDEDNEELVTSTTRRRVETPASIAE